MVRPGARVPDADLGAAAAVLGRVGWVAHHGDGEGDNGVVGAGGVAAGA